MREVAVLGVEAVPFLLFAAIIVFAGLVSCALSAGIGWCFRPWLPKRDASSRAVHPLVVARIAYLLVVLVGFLLIVAYGMYFFGLAGSPVLTDTARLAGVFVGLLLTTLTAQAAFRRGVGGR